MAGAVQRIDRSFTNRCENIGMKVSGPPVCGDRLMTSRSRKEELCAVSLPRLLALDHTR